MTGEEAARVAASLRQRHPGWDVRVTRLFGGLQVEIRAQGSSLFAVIGSEHSVVLAALEASLETAPVPAPLRQEPACEMRKGGDSHPASRIGEVMPDDPTSPDQPGTGRGERLYGDRSGRATRLPPAQGDEPV